jgi:hypothetical protein
LLDRSLTVASETWSSISQKTNIVIPEQGETSEQGDAYESMLKFLAVWSLLASATFTQGQESPPSADASSTPAEEGRILGVIPNNKTVPQIAPVESPLTARGKFNLAFKDTADPFTFVLAAFYAGLAQWQNDYARFGQGGTGYAKRFGAAYADQAVGNYMTEAILPSLLREDPRYFRMGRGSPLRRVRYALSRTVITRTDTGSKTFNYSEVAGNAVAAAISNAYYPASERTAGETCEKLTIQLASDSAFNVILEFWPDMRHAIFKK